MTHVKYLVLGGGPSGLTVATALTELGFDSTLVLEKLPEAGGLCRSAVSQSGIVDVGGGHFLDTKRPRVLEFLFRFLPKKEWNLFDRRATILIGNREVGHPFESHLWQLPLKKQLTYVASCLRWRKPGQAPSASFELHIRAKLGDFIADEYLIPYNRKLWRTTHDDLTTTWIHKLPDVSRKQIWLSLFTRSPFGNLAAHQTFFYPKHYGYHEVWRRMGEALGSRLALNFTIRSIDFRKKKVNNSISYETLITSIPWHCWLQHANVPDEVCKAITNLRHEGIIVTPFSENVASSAHWLYVPDPEKTYHRILSRKNFSEGSSGGWTEANAQAGLRPPDSFVNEYAYPADTISKAKSMAVIREWARCNSIVPLGRWGNWDHINSDVAVEQALQAASDLSTP